MRSIGSMNWLATRSWLRSARTRLFRPEDRERAIAHFTQHPLSELIQNDEFAANVTSQARFDYATFRWMIRLSAISIAAAIVVFLLVGLCVLFSLRSQRVQYLSLSAGWQVLRIYGALQTAAQGILLFALSFWVTALWLQHYSMKLVLLAAVFAVVAVGAVLRRSSNGSTRHGRGRKSHPTKRYPCRLWR